MSVAKPVVEYVNAIKTEKSLSASLDTFKRLIKYQKPYTHFLILIAALSVLRSYLFTLEPLYTSQIIDLVVIGGNVGVLPVLILKILIAVVSFGIVNFLITYLHGYSAQLVIRDLRSDYYYSLQDKSFRFYDSVAVGDLVSRATMDLQPVEGFLRSWVGTLGNAVFTVIIVFGTMYSISPIMSIMSIVPMILVFYFTSQLWMKTMPLFRKMMLILGRLGAYIQQNIIGMRVVRIFQREKEMEEGFKQVEEVYVNTAITAGRIQSIYAPSPQAILTLGIVMIYLYGGNMIASPGRLLTIGELTLFSRYMMRLSFPLRDLGQLVGTWINASAGLERIYEIMDLPVDVKDEFNAQDISIKYGEVVFENVTFGYDKNRPVLKKISFKVKPGEKIAILGATGSGKTTLVYLIPRFYDVDSGSIIIDGVNVKKFKLSSLRRQIGLVLQDVFIFTGTIRDNIAFGNPNASMDSIIRAAKLARIHDFIESLPEGYNTIVGERGVTLSGGQRQRITIARALLTDPKILILDDSLSFVDAKTEQEIQEAIEEAMKGRTCFIIAQRLSTIKNADRIMVLDDGEIVEFGTHEELLAKGGIYKKIYETQFLEKAPPEILEREITVHV
ncbi:MAG: ABC transporter ATP-binding protein [Nitrososphaerota archaeon]|nr:ABC transporter ATP-binding protein/permease [Candidatus Bathyarchaeota archaeon]MDW8048118.1 ABC transporter ATP-binding protein [Nitrososphaerota archaeon]